MIMEKCMSAQFNSDEGEVIIRNIDNNDVDQSEAKIIPGFNNPNANSHANPHAEALEQGGKEQAEARTQEIKSRVERLRARFPRRNGFSLSNEENQVGSDVPLLQFQAGVREGRLARFSRESLDRSDFDSSEISMDQEVKQPDVIRPY
jgi:hypothetical protein